MSKQTRRISVDVALTILIIVSMLAQITGVVAHEIIGVVFFVFIILHLMVSLKWIRSAISKADSNQLEGRTYALLVLSFCLLLDLIVLVVSSIAISRGLAAIGLAPKIMSGFWRDVHTASSYGLCILAVGHLLVHWAQLFSWLHISYDPSRRKAINTGAAIVGCAGAMALGVKCADAFGCFEPSANQDDSTEASAQSKLTNSSSSTKASTFSDVEESSESSSEGGASSASSSGSTAASGTSAGKSSAASDTSSDSDSTDGICPLCKNHCPLSDPQCDKPIKAGLIS